MNELQAGRPTMTADLFKQPPTTAPFPAHRGDPHSSFRAAARMIESGALSRQQAVVLALVQMYPGETSASLARRNIYTHSPDRYQIARRLPELRAKGLVRRDDDGEGDSRWFPTGD